MKLDGLIAWQQMTADSEAQRYAVGGCVKDLPGACFPSRIELG